MKNEEYNEDDIYTPLPDGFGDSVVIVMFCIFGILSLVKLF